MDLIYSKIEELLKKHGVNYQRRDYKQVKHHYTDEKDIPASDDLSTKISKDLKKKGFTFVGPKIIYSYLQAIGIYNDHVIDCDFY